MRTFRNTLVLLGLAVLTAGSLSATTISGQARNRSTTDSQMTGTYELERSRGTNPQNAAEAATRSLPLSRREGAYQRLVSRLESPQWLSIDRSGSSVSIASSRGPRSTFNANGRSTRERSIDGRQTTTRAEINDSRLRVSTNGGSRNTDFMVTFESVNNGSELRVTRRLDDDDLRGPVTHESHYRRTMATPRWDVYGSGRPDARDFDRGTNRGLLDGIGGIPDGMRLDAILDTPISMRTSRTGEPFTMTVRSPEELRGARIDGIVSRIDARREGGAGRDMRLDFQSIEFRGRSSDFDATVNTVRLSDNELVRIDGMDDVRDDDGNRATTIRNGAVGAAVGAVIGAIAGGGTGAVVGGVIGGGAGVILSNEHEQLALPRGAEVTLTVIAPSRRASR